MKTEYILIGGFWKTNQKTVDQICGQIHKHKSSQPVILICLFSRPRTDWDEQFQRISAILTARIPDVECILAEPDIFHRQIDAADVVYLNDGDNLLIEEIMQEMEWFSDAVKGKLIIGSSAGANILAEHYFSRTYNMVRTGLGVIPIKLVAHYGSESAANIDWAEATERIKTVGDQTMVIVKVKEGQAKVLTF